MKVDENGNVIVDNVQPLHDLGDYLYKDYDEVAHTISEELSRGDEDEQMADFLNY